MCGFGSKETDVPTFLFTDCFSLFEAVRQLNPSPAEKSLLKDLYAMKEALQHRVLWELRWCPTGIQYGDCLTKDMDTSVLLNVLRRGNIQVRPTREQCTSNSGVVREHYRFSGVDGSVAFGTWIDEFVTVFYASVEPDELQSFLSVARCLMNTE